MAIGRNSDGTTVTFYLNVGGIEAVARANSLADKILNGERNIDID